MFLSQVCANQVADQLPMQHLARSLVCTRGTEHRVHGITWPETHSHSVCPRLAAEELAGFEGYILANTKSWHPKIPIAKMSSKWTVCYWCWKQNHYCFRQKPMRDTQELIASRQVPEGHTRKCHVKHTLGM